MKNNTDLRTIRVVGKCSDLFYAELWKNDKLQGKYNGYVPNWVPNTGVEHCGDYIEMIIDIDTGTIINWKKPTKEQLNIFC